MNLEAKTLFGQLMNLSENDDTPFFHIDQEKHGDIYRIFSYHFTDKDSWLLPGALESRGITFEIDVTGNPIRIAARPMQKFFNQGEVDFIDYGQPAAAMDKADGSLMSTYLDSSGKLHIKSKGSLSSDHCIAAEAYLEDNKGLEQFLFLQEAAGYTVNMEWVSPDPVFRIVLYYPEPKLIILNVRDTNTGTYLDHNFLSIRDDVVDVHEPDVLENLDEKIGIEGYVVIDTKGNWYKVKCPWYLERHRAKDFVNQPMAFVELVLKEEADDVFTLIADQPEIVEEMRELQHKVITKANCMVNNVTEYFNTNKALTRKDYAIKGKGELDGFEFSLAMMYYTGHEAPEWNTFFLKVLKKIQWIE